MYDKSFHAFRDPNLFFHICNINYFNKDLFKNIKKN